MSIDLKEAVCLITGADEGIGHGLVHGFLKRKARVAAGLFKSTQSSTHVAPALSLQMDVTQPDQVRSAVEKTVKTFGRIDVLINNAGVYPRQSADTMTANDWMKVLDLNLNGVWHCCEAVIPHMKAQRSGVILNVGSICFHTGMSQLAHYEASKGGVVGLTRGLARDLGIHGIRVNCLELGAIQTEGEKKLFPDEQAVLRIVNEKQCLPGRLTPESIESVFAFFASAESGDITGQCLPVDRGWVHN